MTDNTDRIPQIDITAPAVQEACAAIVRSMQATGGEEVEDDVAKEIVAAATLWLTREDGGEG